MSELARSMPGYVEHKVFTADDGERVTLVRFADRASHDAWARHPDHREAQRAGVADYYEEYSIARRRHRPQPRLGAWARGVTAPAAGSLPWGHAQDPAPYLAAPVTTTPTRLPLVSEGLFCAPAR